MEVREVREVREQSEQSEQSERRRLSKSELISIRECVDSLIAHVPDEGDECDALKLAHQEGLYTELCSLGCRLE